jgi:hypothetical protein
LLLIDIDDDDSAAMIGYQTDFEDYQFSIPSSLKVIFLKNPFRLTKNFMTKKFSLSAAIFRKITSDLSSLVLSKTKEP